VIVSLAHRMGWLLSTTTETAVVEKPAEAEDHGFFLLTLQRAGRRVSRD
jgi:hypothetical protein